MGRKRLPESDQAIVCNVYLVRNWCLAHPYHVFPMFISPFDYVLPIFVCYIRGVDSVNWYTFITNDSHNPDVLGRN